METREASPDVHHFITAAARKRAGDTWSSYGVRSEDEAYSYYVQGFRRDVGIAVATGSLLATACCVVPLIHRGAARGCEGPYHGPTGGARGAG